MRWSFLTAYSFAAMIAASVVPLDTPIDGLAKRQSDSQNCQPYGWTADTTHWYKINIISSSQNGYSTLGKAILKQNNNQWMMTYDAQGAGDDFGWDQTKGRLYADINGQILTSQVPSEPDGEPLIFVNNPDDSAPRMKTNQLRCTDDGANVALDEVVVTDSNDNDLYPWTLPTGAGVVLYAGGEVETADTVLVGFDVDS